MISENTGRITIEDCNSVGITQDISAWQEWVTRESSKKNSWTFKLCLDATEICQSCFEIWPTYTGEK